jgi:ketosteroid isomerase-like protein
MAQPIFQALADLIKAGKFHWDEYERKDLQFRFYGDCAVVTGELHAKGTGAKFGAQHTWVADPSASFSGTQRGPARRRLAVFTGSV